MTIAKSAKVVFTLNPQLEVGKRRLFNYDKRNTLLILLPNDSYKWNEIFGHGMK